MAAETQHAPTWSRIENPADGTPVLPRFGGPCTASLVDILVENPDEPPDWFPEGIVGADQIVLWVLDGLGWNQMVDRLSGLRGIPSMNGAAITTVAPSTTSTALTSISTGRPPGEHGVIGYRLDIEGDILNILRWMTSKGDAREAIPPESIQHEPVFGDQRPPVVVRAEFRDSGFSRAHLTGCRHVPYRMNSTLIAEILHQVNTNEPFIYAYYDGIDKVAHEYGLGSVYDAEILLVDRMIEYVIEMLPSDVALVITSDHGQVDVGKNLIQPAPEVMSYTDRQSGEARFRWLHAYPGAAGDLYAAAQRHHSDVAWVVTREQVVDEGWFGPKVLPSPLACLGDVALVSRDQMAFEDPADTGPFVLKGRHGSLTADEMYVPLLVYRK
ncbi:MAG: alkaline phosphatase family protein [Microthrixaceae bacterium]